MLRKAIISLVMSVCHSAYPSACPLVPAQLSVCLSASLSIHPPVHLFLRGTVCLSVCLPVCLSASLSIHPPVHLF